MIKVGILADNPVWEEYLTAFSQGAPFRILGRTGNSSPERFPEIKLLQESDAIWIPEFSENNIEAAIFALRQSRHVLLGFPVATFQNRVSELVKLAREANVDVQVGHHDRYHPAFRAVKNRVLKPQFIKLTHSISDFIPGEQEQLLLHHILQNVDVILALMPEPLKKVNAHISKISSEFGRLIEIRLDFHNGSAASISLSNLGFADSRKLEVSDYLHYYVIDLLEGVSSAYHFQNGRPEETRLWPLKEYPGGLNKIIDEESLTRECVSYFNRKIRNRKPLASIEEGYEALRITEAIFSKIGLQTYRPDTF